MKKVFIVLMAGSGLWTVPAMAQDTATAFTGPYVQAEIGYDRSKSGSDVDVDDLRDSKQSIDGLLYGAGIGFDAAVGENVRLGAEAEITDSTAKWKRDAGEAFNLGRVSAGRDIYVGGKLGYVIGPEAMVYLKGGYTNGRYNLLGTDGTNSSREHLDADGWRLGAGLEYAVNRNTFAKLEYRYSNYSRGELDFRRDIPDSPRFDIDTDRHQVVAAVGMRF
ncbi:MAG: outer membrane beta-barrel protein [Novosphingobium sp.]|nr:outer membrane beta-barrel protein [Novosphingobium sp.]